MECRMCTCYKFEPNQWRRSLCKNCHHGFSAHASDVDDGGQWYFAKVEGPFTWEQMRHWLQAGYFDTDKLLVRNPRVQRGTYQHFSEAFPDSKRAFLPASMGDRIAAAAAAVGADGGGGVGSPGRASGAGLASTAAAEAGVDPDDPYVVEATEAVAGVAATDPATVEWVTRYFGAGDQWYFLDAEEKTQGPFTGEVMTSWFKAGYFWNDKMLVCHHGWDAYVTLASILESATGLGDQLYAAGEDDDGAYRESSSGNEDGEYDDTEEGAAIRGDTHDDVRAAAFADADEAAPAGEGSTVQRTASSLTADVAVDDVGLDFGDEYGGDSDGPSEDGEAGGAWVDDDAHKQWLYADENGASQGPFSASEMRDWVQWDYFSLSTLVRHESCPYFLTVGELWPEGDVFTRGWQPRYSSAVARQDS